MKPEIEFLGNGIILITETNSRREKYERIIDLRFVKDLHHSIISSDLLFIDIDDYRICLNFDDVKCEIDKEYDKNEMFDLFEKLKKEKVDNAIRV